MRRIAPSPALVIALIALFVSLGGVSYGVATGSITGKTIKNNTVGTKDLKNNDIRGGDVRNNSLTGSDVNESKLGKVPSAANADRAASADSAGNASRLGGAAPGAYQERAIAGFRDAQVNLADFSGFHTLATLGLPAGSYAISAKLYVNGATVPQTLAVTCRLVAGTDTDETITSLDPTGASITSQFASVALQVVHTGVTAFSAVVQCTTNTIGGGLALTAGHVKITALPVDSLTNQALSG